ncbi:hypothetical protein CLOM621_08281 [Clostridium sp. M62/1]|nr:hypothetical protein CLOM621_08281 [Clostridium sp. M62/1]
MKYRKFTPIFLHTSVKKQKYLRHYFFYATLKQNIRKMRKEKLT